VIPAQPPFAQEDAERAAAEALRAAAGLPPRQLVPLDAPLLQLGLDSLALVQFLVGLEAAFGRAIPDAAWAGRNAMTVRDFAALAAASPRPAKPHAGRTPDRPKRRSALARLARRSAALAMRPTRLLFERSRHAILLRDLSRRHALDRQSTGSWELRTLTTGDEPTLDGFWTPAAAPRGVRQFRERAAAGDSCFAACRDGKAMALVWLATRAAQERCSGLHLRLKPGACYVYDLRERSGVVGAGAGLAVAGHALRAARAMGSLLQVSIVDLRNDAMLATARRLLGFEIAGRVVHTRIVWWRRVRWRVEGRSGQGILDL